MNPMPMTQEEREALYKRINADYTGDERPTTPGEAVDLIRRAYGLTKNDLAMLLEVDRTTIHNLMTARTRMTPQLALMIGRLFGRVPSGFLLLQDHLDLWKWEKNPEFRKRLERIVEVPALRPSAQLEMGKRVKREVLSQE